MWRIFMTILLVAVFAGCTADDEGGICLIDQSPKVTVENQYIITLKDTYFWGSFNGSNSSKVNIAPNSSYLFTTFSVPLVKDGVWGGAVQFTIGSREYVYSKYVWADCSTHSRVKVDGDTLVCDPSVTSSIGYFMPEHPDCVEIPLSQAVLK